MPLPLPHPGVAALPARGGRRALADAPTTPVRAGSATRSDSHGLLIIRAWVEEGSDERLRAEVRVTTDVSAGMQRTVTLARTEEVRATIEAWLVEVLAQGATPV